MDHVLHHTPHNPLLAVLDRDWVLLFRLRYQVGTPQLDFVSLHSIAPRGPLRTGRRPRSTRPSAPPSGGSPGGSHLRMPAPVVEYPAAQATKVVSSFPTGPQLRSREASTWPPEGTHRKSGCGRCAPSRTRQTAVPIDHGAMIRKRATEERETRADRPISGRVNPEAVLSVQTSTHTSNVCLVHPRDCRVVGSTTRCMCRCGRRPSAPPVQFSFVQAS